MKRNVPHFNIQISSKKNIFLTVTYIILNFRSTFLNVARQQFKICILHRKFL